MLKLFTSSSRPSCCTFRNEFYSSRFLFSSLPNKRILQTFLERKSFIYFPTTDPIISISRFFFYEQLLVSNLFLPEILCNSIAFFHTPRNSRSSRKFENETNAFPSTSRQTSKIHRYSANSVGSIAARGGSDRCIPAPDEPTLVRVTHADTGSTSRRTKRIAPRRVREEERQGLSRN